MLAEIGERCNAIEECYEFMLAYAAQGLPTDQAASPADSFASSWAAPPKRCAGWPEPREGGDSRKASNPAERYEAFLEVLVRDARDSLAAMELVLRAACDQLSVDRQPERFDSSSRAAHGRVFVDRNGEASALASKPAASSGWKFSIPTITAILLVNDSRGEGHGASAS